MQLILLGLIAVVLLFSTPRSTAHAQTQLFSYEIKCHVHEDDWASVNFKVKITNKTKEKYATGFEMKVEHPDMKDIEATLDGSPITYTTRTEGNSITLTALFPDGITGIDASKTVEIKYKTRNVVIKNGNQKNIIFPQIASEVGTERLEMEFHVPQSFGDPTYISSEPTRENSGTETTFKFDKTDSSSLIVIAFGEPQYYQFDLNYYLENSDSEPIKVPVVIPPDTPTQSVYFQEADPLPDFTVLDESGNYIAYYVLKPQEAKTISVKGAAQVFRKTEKTNLDKLSNEQRQNFTSKQKYWDIDHPKILSTAKDLTKDIESTEEKAKILYNYTIENLSYSQEELQKESRERLGAANALENKDRAICLDYADLFVSMTRAIGIPSRVVIGYVYKTSGYDLSPNILHAWAEFYDEEKGWIAVDPTWEDSSGGLDHFGNIGLNHLAIAQYAASSENPDVILSYTSGDSIEDNIRIQESDKLDLSSANPNSPIEVEIDEPQRALSGLATIANMNIKNVSNQITRIDQITMDRREVQLPESPEQGKELLLFPDETQVMTLNFSVNDWLFQGEKTYEIEIISQVGLAQEYSTKTSKTLKFSRSTRMILLSWGITLALGIGLPVGIFYGYSYYKRRKKLI